MINMITVIVDRYLFIYKTVYRRPVCTLGRPMSTSNVLGNCWAVT